MLVADLRTFVVGLLSATFSAGKLLPQATLLVCRYCNHLKSPPHDMIKTWKGEVGLFYRPTRLSFLRAGDVGPGFANTTKLVTSTEIFPGACGKSSWHGLSCQ